MLALEHRAARARAAWSRRRWSTPRLNIAAEQVIESSAYGALLARDGNRGPAAAPQNLYQAADPDEYGRDDSWVAIAVATDEQWASLRRALGEPDWAADPALATAAGRSARARPHRRAPAGGAATGRPTRSSRRAVGRRGPRRQGDAAPPPARAGAARVPRLLRGGGPPGDRASRYSTLPMRSRAARSGSTQRHAPLLGEHNEELLGELGLTPVRDRRARSRRDHRWLAPPGH